MKTQRWIFKLFTFCLLLMSAMGWGQKTYQLITDLSSLEVGKGYLIVNSNLSGSGQALGYQNTNNRPQAPVTISTGTIPSITSNIATTNSDTTTPFELILGGSAGAWTFYDGPNAGYIYAASNSSNHLKTQSSSTTWTISFNNEAAILTSQTGVTRNILRYNSIGLFSCYTSGQSSVYLYKEVASCTTPTQSFANSTITKNTGDPAFTNIFTTNSSGAVTYSSSNTNVATVNPTTGEVTIVGIGPANITAATAVSAPYCAATLSYSLMVNSTSPSISATPVSLSFSSNLNTTSTTQTVTVTGANLSGAPTVSITGTDAAMFSQTGALSTTGGILNITFTPTSSGAKTAVLQITGDGQTATVNLSGSAIVPLHFRSQASGNWDTATTWESSPDNINWQTATASPTSVDETVTIQNGHTVTINGAVNADQIVIENGGILNPTSSGFVINDGIGDDLIIQSGGILKYTASAGLPTFNNSATISNETGGKIQVSGSGIFNSTGTTSIHSANYVYRNSSILEWNSSNAPAFTGLTFFPNADSSTIPVLRFSDAPSGTIGGGSATIVNGVVEVPSGITVNIAGAGLKTFRNGVRGEGIINRTASGTIFTGTQSQIGGTVTLNIAHVNGLTVDGTINITGNLNLSSEAQFAGNVINNGTITVASDGNFVQGTGSVYSGSGTFTLNRATATSAGNYTFWSSPVEGQNMHAIFGSGTPQYVMEYLTATDTYGVLPNPSSAMAGKGYAIKVPGAGPVTFTGMPNNGQLTGLVLTLGGQGYNLVGNPYPSSLNLNTLHSVNSSKIDTGFYFFNNNNTAPQWITYNVSGTWSNGSSTASSVKPGQGFIVTATAAGNLEFNNSMRNADTGAFFNNKAAQSVTDGKYWLKLSSPAGVENTFAVTYGYGASNAFDAYDSKMMSIGSDSFYSMEGTNKLAIQGRADFVNTDVVLLGNKQSADGSYTISLADTVGMFAGNAQAIYLHDKYLGTYTDLQNQAYTFSAIAGEQTNRFEVVYVNSFLATAEAVKTADIKVYSTGSSFAVESPVKIESLEIYDASGRLVDTKTPNAKKAEFTVSAKGVYIVKVKAGNREISKKVIK